MSIKRYACDNSRAMYEIEDGPFMRHDDHTAEIARKDARIAELESAARDLLSALDIEARASMSYDNARENFSSGTCERKHYERSMLAASKCSKRMRDLCAPPPSPSTEEGVWREQ